MDLPEVTANSRSSCVSEEKMCSFISSFMGSNEKAFALIGFVLLSKREIIQALSVKY
jgi:hypothetical protein